MQQMMKPLKLTVNEAKTQVCSIPEDSVDFLGYTLGRCYSPKTGRAYIGTRPSKKAIQHVCGAIHEATASRWQQTEAQERVRRLNAIMMGWANYFCLGPVGAAYRRVDRHARHRLRQWLRGKHKTPGQGRSRFPDTYLDEQLGWVRLEERTRNLPWANA